MTLDIRHTQYLLTDFGSTGTSTVGTCTDTDDAGMRSDGTCTDTEGTDSNSTDTYDIGTVLSYFH